MEVRDTRVDYTHRIPYGHHPVSGRPGPYVPVSVTNPATGDSIDTLVIIDSGARFPLLSGDHAIGLNLTIRNGRREPFRPAAAAVDHEAFLHPLEVSVGDFTFPCEVGFVEGPLVRDALGREGFFDCVQIGFREYAQEIYLILNR